MKKQEQDDRRPRSLGPSLARFLLGLHTRDTGGDSARQFLALDISRGCAVRPDDRPQIGSWLMLRTTRNKKEDTP